MKELIIMSGPPCSGKTNYVLKHFPHHTYISRDAIREELFGKNYKYSEANEKLVNKEQNKMFQKCLVCLSNDVVVDNTHCSKYYFTSIIKKFKGHYKIKIVALRQPLYKLYIRNIIRYMSIGKWIPFGVIKDMNNRQKKIDYAKIQNTL